MSAYIVEEAVIAEIAKIYASQWAPRDSMDWTLRLEEAVNWLAEANIDSVRELYGPSSYGDIPEHFANACRVYTKMTALNGKEYSPVQLLKAIDCYEYNADNADGWRTSKAKKVVDTARRAVNRRLPGYAEAEWGLTP